MSKKTFDEKMLGPKALEMVMRDVLGGMEEFSLLNTYDSTTVDYKVIAINPYRSLEDIESLTAIAGDEKTHIESKGPADIIILDEYLKRKKRK